MAQAAKKHGVSETTIYAWCKKLGQQDVTDVRQLKQLKQENVQVKKPLAERDLEIEVFTEANQKSGERTRASPSGSICEQDRYFTGARVLDVFGGSTNVRLSIEDDKEGCTRIDFDAMDGTFVSAYWLPAHCHSFTSRRTLHEL